MAVILVAGQRTHGTTYLALKVTSRVATPGAVSAVCDCIDVTASGLVKTSVLETPSLPTAAAAAVAS